MKDQSLEEPTEDEPEISFAAKPNRLNSSQQSIEIPVQPSTPPLAYDSSPASILEQFGTIIKKEAVVVRRSLARHGPVFKFRRCCSRRKNH